MGYKLERNPHYGFYKYHLRPVMLRLQSIILMNFMRPNHLHK